MLHQNVSTRLVSSEFNNQIFKLLGNEVFALASGFAEISMENRINDERLTLGQGVICYVRDYAERSMKLRFFGVEDAVLEVWNTIVEPDELFDKISPNRVAFERNVQTSFLIDFIDTEEAEQFFNQVSYLQSRRPHKISATQTSGKDSGCESTVQLSPRVSAITPSGNDAFKNELNSVLKGKQNSASKNTERSVMVSVSKTSDRSVEAASHQNHVKEESGSAEISNSTTALQGSVKTWKSALPPSTEGSACGSHRSSCSGQRSMHWIHGETFRRFTFSYDDSCDAYEKLILQLRRIQQDFKGRLQWKDADRKWVGFTSDDELRHIFELTGPKEVVHVKTVQSLLFPIVGANLPDDSK